jgi:hypothetical protein
VSARLVPPVRDLVGEHPRAARCSPEQVAGLLWILLFVADEEDGPPDAYEVADALEVLDVHRGMAARAPARCWPSLTGWASASSTGRSV